MQRFLNAYISTKFQDNRYQLFHTSYESFVRPGDFIWPLTSWTRIAMPHGISSFIPTMNFLWHYHFRVVCLGETDRQTDRQTAVQCATRSPSDGRAATTKGVAVNLKRNWKQCSGKPAYFAGDCFVSVLILHHTAAFADVFICACTTIRPHIPSKYMYKSISIWLVSYSSILK